MTSLNVNFTSSCSEFHCVHPTDSITQLDMRTSPDIRAASSTPWAGHPPAHPHLLICGIAGGLSGGRKRPRLAIQWPHSDADGLYRLSCDAAVFTLQQG